MSKYKLDVEVLKRRAAEYAAADYNYHHCDTSDIDLLHKYAEKAKSAKTGVAVAAMLFLGYDLNDNGDFVKL